jgi:hypothetical protein
MVSALRPPTDLLFMPHVIYESGERQRNDIDRENRTTRRKTSPSSTLSTKNRTRTDSGAKLACAARGRRLTA